MPSTITPSSFYIVLCFSPAFPVERNIYSWWRKEEMTEEEVEKKEAKGLEVRDESGEEENMVSSAPLSPHMSSMEQVQEPNKSEESSFWTWLSPFSFLSGLITITNRYKHKPQQEPICCLLDKRRSPSKMCSECKIYFCRKCEVLHYNQCFIEHSILGHTKEELGNRGLGIIQPILSPLCQQLLHLAACRRCM
uniref:DUF4637 domain-containing protein n=1 Tax=Crocodylus porosus TaxID=8502 RepID=A0A7M4EDU6_CROPO